MPSRARERQLAKLAARRQAERSRRKRRRDIILAVIGGIAALALIAVGLGFLLGGNDTTSASPSATPATPSASATPSKPPGTQTGTVTPKVAPAATACGAQPPAGAGKPKPQFSGPPPMKIDPKKTYVATMATSCGTITIQLDAASAPKTVNSFVFLARKGFFDGQYFTRLDTSIDVVQGGDPTETGGGGPGYRIPDELSGKESYVTGTVAMANGGANTGGSQFFLITGPNGKKLDANPAYTIFGKITGGLDVAQEIQGLPVIDPAKAKQGDIASQAPKQAIYIDRVTIAER